MLTVLIVVAEAEMEHDGGQTLACSKVLVAGRMPVTRYQGRLTVLSDKNNKVSHVYGEAVER